jgi:uncharacterized GH25 family protein
MKTTLPSVLLLVSSAGLAGAHDTWLLPGRFQVAPGETVTLGLTSAMAFPAPETAVKAERLAERKVRLAGKTSPLAPGAASRDLRLSGPAGAGGIATAWIATRPRTLTLTPEQVEEYLEEIGGQETVGAEWKKSGQKTWRETYVKLAKTFVRVGETADRSWSEPVGLDFELLPEADPTRLSVGGRLSLVLLWQGRPLPGFPVGAVPAPPGKARLLKTDAEGRLSLSLDQAGPWLLRATRVAPSTARPGEWDSVFTTLTLGTDH